MNYMFIPDGAVVINIRRNKKCGFVKNAIPGVTHSVMAHVIIAAFYNAVVVIAFATIHAVIIAKISA